MFYTSSKTFKFRTFRISNENQLLICVEDDLKKTHIVNRSPVYKFKLVLWDLQLPLLFLKHLAV